VIAAVLAGCGSDGGGGGAGAPDGGGDAAVAADAGAGQDGGAGADSGAGAPDGGAGATDGVDAPDGGAIDARTDDTGPDAATDAGEADALGPDAAEPDAEPVGPSFATVYPLLITDSGCNDCHSFYSTPEKARTRLLNTSFCGGKLVVPGDVAASTLIGKVVAGEALSCGGKMPKGSAGVSAAAAEALKAWIAGGALP
jgi:hypothetical protein